MKFARTFTFATAAMALTLSTHVAAQSSTSPAPRTPAARVMAATNNARITLAGKVISKTPISFQLDIGRDTITVEMDDRDWFKETSMLLPGDQVIVSGRVDKDLWESKKIEASSVYVTKLGVTFHASAQDEEDLSTALVLVSPVSSSTGTVIAAEGQEITLGSPSGPVRVDMGRLSVRPVLKIGDRVHAWGDLDVDSREKLELMAKGIAVLTKARTPTW